MMVVFGGDSKPPFRAQLTDINILKSLLARIIGMLEDCNSLLRFK